ncbi:M16 family metallopeptidase [Kaarinaea lacus]
MSRMHKIVVILALILLVSGIVFVIQRERAHDITLAPISENGLSIQSWQTSNGAKVMYVHAPQLPMVDVRVVFNAGSARDGGKYGLARLTNAMLSQGAGEWNTDQLAERFDDIGAIYSNATDEDMAVVQIRTLSEKTLLDQAVRNLVAVINQPRFEPGELERLRKQVLISLKNRMQSPGAIINDAFMEAMYGEHPYARPTVGLESSVRAINVDDVKDFYQRYYVASNAVVAIVGDIDRHAADKLAEKLVGKLPEGEAAKKLPQPQALTTAKTEHITHPSTQTHILVGQPGMRRGDEDYFTLYVGNHILGGSGFGSRVMKEIREKRGLAYSAYSYFSPMQVDGPFTMGLQTQNGKRDEALTILNQVLREFIEKGPSADELDHAKKNITGGFALRIDSNKDIVNYIAMIGFYDLPLDYLNTFNQKVEAVTVEGIRDTFARRIDPDKLLTVTVGDNVQS